MAKRKGWKGKLIRTTAPRRGSFISCDTLVTGNHTYVCLTNLKNGWSQAIAITNFDGSKGARKTFRIKTREKYKDFI